MCASQRSFPLTQLESLPRMRASLLLRSLSKKPPSRYSRGPSTSISSEPSFVHERPSKYSSPNHPREACTQLQCVCLYKYSSDPPLTGRIINNGSISAYTPRPHSSPYTSSKHAVLGMTKSTLLDGRAFNITCTQVDIGRLFCSPLRTVMLKAPL